MKDNRCTLPFSYPTEISLFDGTAATCCKTPKVPLDPVTGALTPQLIELRKSVIHNERNEQCRKCWEIDDAGGPSQRKRYSKHFNEVVEWDKLDPMQPIKHASITFSNKCQLMCFYCSSGISSMWEDYEKKNNTYIPIVKQSVISDINDVIDVSQLEWIHVTGGEPLLEPKCIDFLMNLPYNPNRKIALVTNLSYGQSTFNTLLEIIKKHKNIGITCSLDAIGDNVSRKYHNWDLWDRNFKKLAEGWEIRRLFYKGQYLHINIVASMLNYKDIQAVIEYAISYRKKGIHISFSISQVALDERGSILSAELSDGGIIQLSDEDNSYLNQKERDLIEGHNNMIANARVNSDLKNATDTFLKKYSGT